MDPAARAFVFLAAAAAAMYYCDTKGGAPSPAESPTAHAVEALLQPHVPPGRLRLLVGALREFEAIARGAIAPTTAGRLADKRAESLNQLQSLYLEVATGGRTSLDAAMARVVSDTGGVISGIDPRYLSLPRGFAEASCVSTYDAWV
jgi:hypothetical protein